MDKITNESFLLTLLLLYFRVVLLFFTVPFFGSPFIPIRIRLLLALSFSFAVLLNNPQVEPIAINTFEEFILKAISELTFGFLASLILRLAFEALVIAGELVAVHSGLGFLQMFLPGQQQISLLAGFFSIYGTVLFLSVGGAEIVLIALSDSLRNLPPGSFNIFSLNPEMYLQFFYESFSLGVKLSMPVLITALLLNVVLAVVNRFIPQMNVFMVGLPLQVVVGLIVLILSLPVITLSISEHFREFLIYFVRFLGS